MESIYFFFQKLEEWSIHCAQVSAIFRWAALFFTLLGLLAAIRKAWRIWRNMRVLTWKEVDRYVKRIIKQIRKADRIPDVIIGVGRGGAVCAALLSGNMCYGRYSRNRKANIPILAIERFYRWDAEGRAEVDNEMIDLRTLAGKRVLLVAGYTETGGTLKSHLRRLHGAGVTDVQTASIVRSPACEAKLDYYAERIPTDFQMPWMYPNHGYIRDSRPVGEQNLQEC